MSEIRVTSVVGENGGDRVGLTTGLTVGPLTGTTGIGATITHQGHAQFAGVCTATSFSGSGANLTGISGGKILQVVQTVKTDVFSETSLSPGTFTGAILSATITPTLSTSKILIMACLSVSISNDNRIGMGIFRGGSIITASIGDANSSNNRVAVSSLLSSTSFQANMNVHFLDSPSTTSATTYDIRGTHGRNSSVTFYAGRENTTATSNDRMRSAQFLTLMEVEA